MTFKRLLGIVGALCAVAVLTGSVGAGAARTPAKQAVNLSTKAAVKQYLRSIHVNPKGVVIQRGLRNYAGSSCPGAGWTCTSTSHPVVQVASTGGSNVFQCASSSCAVVQTAAATSRHEHGEVHQDHRDLTVVLDHPDERDQEQRGDRGPDCEQDERTDAECLSDRSDHPEGERRLHRCERQYRLRPPDDHDRRLHRRPEKGDAGNRHAGRPSVDLDQAGLELRRQHSQERD